MMFKRFYLLLFVMVPIISFADQATSFVIPKECKGWPAVPSNLDEAIKVLASTFGKDQLKVLKALTEKEVIPTGHFTLGIALRNCWGLWCQSKLGKYFERLGIDDPDDMSSIILLSLWRHMNNKPILLNEQIEDCKRRPKQTEDQCRRTTRSTGRLLGFSLRSAPAVAPVNCYVNVNSKAPVAIAKSSANFSFLKRLSLENQGETRP